MADRFRFTTSWGAGALAVEGGNVVEVTVPGAPLPDGLADIARAPALAREVAARIAAFCEGNVTSIATTSEISAWLHAAGVGGFRRDVLMALAEVPYGETIPYGELAARAGRPLAARAAGTACATNPLPLVIPCHRIVPASGAIGNYGGTGPGMGPGYKRRLLELEGALAPS